MQWRTAYGSDPVIESVLVQLTAEDGSSAWGETCALGSPTYSPEHAAGIYSVPKLPKLHGALATAPLPPSQAAQLPKARLAIPIDTVGHLDSRLTAGWVLPCRS